MTTLEHCQQLAEQDPNIEVLWLYGSQAKGTATAHSDHDFAVAFKHIKKDTLEQRLVPILLAQQWADALGVEDNKISIVDINHRSEEHTSELQSRPHLVCRLLLEKKNRRKRKYNRQHEEDAGKRR